MKWRNFLCASLIFAAIMVYFPIPVNAMEIPSKNVISLENLKWEWVDLSTVECPEDSILPLANVSADGAYSAHSTYAVKSIYFQAGSAVTFNCSYSPSSAIMDFGVISPDGKFYYVTVKGGSIDQSIRISQAGSYSVAIRNNSSQTVRVVGFVDY